ncbi:MAG: hypothetical protein U0271_15865 [Polyangiaceae bacterium]
MTKKASLSTLTHVGAGAVMMALAFGSMQACGDDTSDGGSGDFQQNCKDFCAGAYSLQCGMQQITVEQCQAQCGFLELQLDGQCVDEYSATFRCAADGGFECVNDNVVPKSACISESTALSQCLETMPCKKYCAEAVPAGCGSSTSTCESECQTERDILNESLCDFEYDDLLQCWTDNGVTCVAGAPSPAGCDSEALQVANCLSFDAMCDGWCWAADLYGCGDGCAASCAAKIGDASCGSYYSSYLSCAMSFEQTVACTGGELAPTACESERTQYESCVSGM